MKIFFESFESFRLMFEPLIGKDLELVIGGRKEQVKLLGLTSGVLGLDVAYIDTGSESIIAISKVWEIHVP